MSLLDKINELVEENPDLERFVGYFSGTTDQGVPIDQVAVRLLLACVIGWLIGQVYRRTFTGRRFSPTLPDTHMLLCLGGAMIWLVVGDNLVRAFGLAGTIGLIRYRTVVRDPKDTTILLFSMVLGMACGLGSFAVALIGMIVVLLVMVFLHFSHRRGKKAQAQDADKLLGLLDSSDDPPDQPRKPNKKDQN